jgi:hypothetical protein
MAKPTAVERALREVQGLMRAIDETLALDKGGYHVPRVAAVLGQDDGARISFSDDVAAALRTAEVALLADQHGFQTSWWSG